MIDDERFKLRFGPYKTPRFSYGATVQCEVWGEVQIVGQSDGRLPWPLGRRKGTSSRASLIVYKGLAKAVSKEANQAICHWWGVCPTTVWKWRKALGVPTNNEGTTQLRSEYFQEDWAKEAQKKAVSKARDPQRRAKIAAARRGKKRPPHVIEALRRANTGRKLGKAHRQKMSEAHKKRGTRPPWLNAPWTPEEDELLRTLPPKEVAKRTGRTMPAVLNRRHKLKLPDGRRRRAKT